MAQKATVFKATLHISDINKHLYQDFQLTIARHPSETDERMMVRLVAFALNAAEQLEFTKGLCADDEPEIWQKSLGGVIEQWIEVGLPSEDRMRKACNRSQQALVYAYGTERNVGHWWNKLSHKLTRFNNLQVFQLAYEATQALVDLVKPSMQLQCMIEDDELWVSDESHSIPIKIKQLITS